MTGPYAWEDGLGRWHASVPLSPLPRIEPGSTRKEAAHARRLIMAELSERTRFGARPVFSIRRERVTNHGTVIYGER